MDDQVENLQEVATNLPSWIPTLATWLGVPLSSALILGLGYVALRTFLNFYNAQNARSDGVITSFEQLKAILELRNEEVERLTRVAESANARADQAIRERNDAVAEAAADKVRVENLTRQVEILTERVRHLEGQLEEFIHILKAQG